LLRNHDTPNEVMGTVSDKSSFFIRHLNDGQKNPSPWDYPIRQWAEAAKLPLDRFEHACRIMNFYYPRECRRAWTCLDDNHCVAKGRHAQALAEFELNFKAAGMDEAAQCEEVVRCITAYLRKGKDYYWLWEALVEDVQAVLGLSANGKERIARWFSCGALRAYYPYIGGKKYWDEIKHDYDGNARHALELIRFEYEFTRDHRDLEELDRERGVAERFASRLRSDADRQLSTEIMKGKPRAYTSSIVPNARGVYARFRELDDPVPMYVGMGNLRRAMADRHSYYSGDRQIYLKCFEDDDCHTTEKKLLAIFDPPENSHRTPRQWIKHPDELPEWFL
jgi:hypothetical protein